MNKNLDPKCCICGDDIELDRSGYRMAHNPEPVASVNEQCCSYCNGAVVIPERMRLFCAQTPGAKLTNWIEI